MDTVTLVGKQIDDGQRLLDRLGEEGIVVRAACWVKPVEEDRWSLYIATPLMVRKDRCRHTARLSVFFGPWIIAA
jgi:hypothetical protein